MSKRCRRFFGGLLAAQANWLNTMADKGYRLSRTEKLLYEFEPCTPGKYQYQVEFIGQKAKESANDYARFLEECGYRVFLKNINLNYSAGKAVCRHLQPRASDRGKRSGRKGLRTAYDYEDRVLYYKSLRKPWLFLLLVSTVLGLAMKAWAWGVFALAALAAVLVYQIELTKLRQRSKTKEW